MSLASLPPLEDDDLLSEILLRLPPQPSSLPRARAVSRRWRSLASHPRFCARFRAHHRRNPPLLGCFVEEHFPTNHQPILTEVSFWPALEAPNRVPEGHITFPIARDHLRILGCRHGLVLTFHRRRDQVLVWDPVSGSQHRLDPPPGFDFNYPASGAALRAAGDDVHHFQVVLVGRSDSQHARAIASVYSSKTGAWGNLVSTPLPVDGRYGDSVLHPGLMPAVMVGDSLYWLFVGDQNPIAIVEFGLDSWSLALIPTPEEIVHCYWRPTEISVVPAQGGGLGFLFLSEFSARLWKRKTNSAGVPSWVLGTTIAVDKLLPINLEKERECLRIIGLAEDSNMVLLKSCIHIFTVHLESLEYKKIYESNSHFSRYVPFEVVYTADNGVDGGHDGPELLQNV